MNIRDERIFKKKGRETEGGRESLNFLVGCHTSGCFIIINIIVVAVVVIFKSKYTARAIE